MKTILCYGDSNTWGFMPKKDSPAITANNRYPWGVRWTSLVQMQLGENYRVAENGVNGRTTMFDCPLADYRNGLKDMEVGMQSQMPVDLVIIMLGTNDVKGHLGMPPYIISRGAGRLIEKIRMGGYGPDGASPEILLMAPIRMHPEAVNGWIAGEFTAESYEKDGMLDKYYRATAEEYGVHYMNAGEFVTADPADGIHMNEEGHAILAEKVTAKVKEILG